MARIISAGLLVFRRSRERGVEFLLVHPGGPYWRNKDDGAWSIPKGLVEPSEDMLEAAIREFGEEVGLSVAGTFSPLTARKQRGGKTIVAWTVEADLDLNGFHSNTCKVEWPPRSGRTVEVPECDQARYLPVEEARRKILPGQTGFIDDAIDRL